MDLGCICTMMVAAMRVNFRTICVTDMGYTKCLLGTGTMVIGSSTNDTGMGSSTIDWLMKLMRDFFSTIEDQDRANTCSEVAMYFRGNGGMTRKMVWEFCYFIVEMCLGVHGKRILSFVSIPFCCIRMGTIFWVDIGQELEMGTGSIFFTRGRWLKENGWEMTEFWGGLSMSMGMYMKGIFTEGSEKELGNICMLMEVSLRGFGEMINSIWRVLYLIFDSRVPTRIVNMEVEKISLSLHTQLQ